MLDLIHNETECAYPKESLHVVITQIIYVNIDQGNGYETNLRI